MPTCDSTEKIPTGRSRRRLEFLSLELRDCSGRGSDLGVSRARAPRSSLFSPRRHLLSLCALCLQVTRQPFLSYARHPPVLALEISWAFLPGCAAQMSMPATSGAPAGAPRSTKPTAARSEDGGLRRLVDAGLVPDRNPGRASRDAHRGRRVRRLPHGRGALHRARAPPRRCSAWSPTTSRAWRTAARCYTVACLPSGGIVDDLIVYRLARRPLPRGRQRLQHRQGSSPGSQEHRGADCEIDDASARDRPDRLPGPGGRSRRCSR